MAHSNLKPKILVGLLVFLVGGVLITSTGLWAGDKAAKKEKEVPAAEAEAITPTAGAAAPVGPAWDVRCAPVKNGEEVVGEYCEMVQNLSVIKKDADPSTAQRIVEIAIGYPPVEKGKASSLLILPLGILVTEDIVVEVDERKEMTAKIRHCEANGCVAMLPITPKIINKMASGKTLRVKAVAATGQPVTIDMSLEGFKEAHDRLVKN